MKMIMDRTNPISTEEIARDIEDCVKLGGTIDGERVRRILQDFAEKMERQGIESVKYIRCMKHVDNHGQICGDHITGSECAICAIEYARAYWLSSTQPPILNDYVLDGCEQFSSEPGLNQP